MPDRFTIDDVTRLLRRELSPELPADAVEDAYPVSFNFERYPYVPLPRRGRKVEFPFGDNVSLRS